MLSAAWAIPTKPEPLLEVGAASINPVTTGHGSNVKVGIPGKQITDGTAEEKKCKNCQAGYIYGSGCLICSPFK
jgi:hypothetical protein